jgi:hypothetical protein
MTELELILTEAGATLEWPETPDLAGRVAARIRKPARRAPRLRRPLVVALAALLILAAGAAAIPGVRHFLGFGSVRVERVPKLPLRPGPGAKLALGARTTLADANVGFQPLVPTALGRPAVYVDRTPPGGQLSLLYRNGHLLLTEVQGRVRQQFLQKFVGPGTTVERVTIDGAPGLWIQGALHEVVYEDRKGLIRPDTIRLVGDTLLWRRGPVLLRLEGARRKAEALRIARSLRAAP